MICYEKKVKVRRMAHPNFQIINYKSIFYPSISEIKLSNPLSTEYVSIDNGEESSVSITLLLFEEELEELEALEEDEPIEDEFEELEFEELEEPDVSTNKDDQSIEEDAPPNNDEYADEDDENN